MLLFIQNDLITKAKGSLYLKTNIDNYVFMFISAQFFSSKEFSDERFFILSHLLIMSRWLCFYLRIANALHNNASLSR